MMDERITLDVFGRRIVAERSESGWRAWYPGADGKRRPADFVIPPHLGTEGVARYLDDLFHELASDAHPKVRIL